jgi:putative ABC transport system substrate-binding protein
MALMRAALTVALVLGILAAPPTSEAQPARKIPVVGYLWNSSEALAAPNVAAFRQGMQELGYAEGQNFTLVSRYADGQFDRFPALLKELIEAKSDILVTAGPQAGRAVKRATDTLPVVMAVISDPVTEGLVQSLARPGGNITGIAFQNTELTAKRLELLKRVIPSATRIAALADSTFGRSAGLQELQAAARSLGLELHVVEVRGPADFEAAFRSARNARAEGLVVLASPLLSAHRKSLIAHAAKNRLPATYEVRTFVDDGGLMSYGPNFQDMYRRPAIYVDKILKGARPADLPVEQASRFDLVVNLKTAKALGLTIPPSVLERADEVIK